jgi:hypothetical protein
MIFVNPDAITIPTAREDVLKLLTEFLLGWPEDLRSEFIEGSRVDAWAHRDITDALEKVVVTKCWYSEVHLEGADPNVDHFRPKGAVREVGRDFEPTGDETDGYWWLAFEPGNYRLAAMHSNQRRVDHDTQGGKWNYFPLRGARAVATTPLPQIEEDILPLDPCVFTDVQLLWFDSDGTPGPITNEDNQVDEREAERVRATIWLYHLNKQEIQIRRAAYVAEIRKDLKKADSDYRLWDRHSQAPNLHAKTSFNQKLAEIRTKISDQSVFAGAKRCAVRGAIVDYPWIEQFNVL